MRTEREMLAGVNKDLFESFNTKREIEAYIQSKIDTKEQFIFSIDREIRHYKGMLKFTEFDIDDKVIP